MGVDQTCFQPCNSDRLLDDINLRAKVSAKSGAGGVLLLEAGNVFCFQVGIVAVELKWMHYVSCFSIEMVWKLWLSGFATFEKVYAGNEYINL